MGGTRSATPSVVVAPVRAGDGTFWTDTRLLLNRGTLLDPQTGIWSTPPSPSWPSPPRASPWEKDSEDNYKYTMHVVDINDPTKSSMLIKPTRPTDSAGNVSDYLATHNAAKGGMGMNKAGSIERYWSGFVVEGWSGGEIGPQSIARPQGVKLIRNDVDSPVVQ